MKKGFTLVELLATIVILAIIMLIGVSSYKSINERIKKQEYENKVKYIETQAASFASSTGYLSTNVNQLVELGFVNADNDKMEVLNPVNKEVLNDHVVTITREGESYYGHFTDTEEADLNKIDRINENLEIVVTTSSGKVLEDGEWTQENVTLSTHIKKSEIDVSKITMIKWYSNGENKVIPVNNNYETLNSYPINVIQILNTNYRVELEFSDGTKFDATRIVKVDKQKPVVYKEDVKVDNEDTYTKNNKKVRIIASDQRGSGIDGYYLGTDPVCKNNQLHKSSEESYEAELGSGTYYSCVVDKVGNESETISFEVKNIDTTVPTCTIIPSGTMGKNGWYTSDVTFKIEGKDEESGIRNTSLSTEKLASDNASYTVEGVVTDKAGNEGKCSLTVKRDATKPTCNWSGESTSWTKENRTITATCQDGTSGCIKESNSQAYTSGTTKIASLSYGLEDQAGNTNSCSKTVDVYVDKEGPTAPTSGSIGDVSGLNTIGSIQGIASGSVDAGSGIKEYRYKVTNNGATPDKNSFTTNRNFTRACGTSYYAWAVAVDNVGNISEVRSLGVTSDGANSYTGWSGCNRSCGGGQQTRSNTCALVTTGLSQSCNTQGCCTNTRTETSGDWSACICDNSVGHKYQSRTVTTRVISNYDGSICSTTTNNEFRYCDTSAFGLDGCYVANGFANVRGTSPHTVNNYLNCSHNGQAVSLGPGSLYYNTYNVDASGNVWGPNGSPKACHYGGWEAAGYCSGGNCSDCYGFGSCTHTGWWLKYD